MGLTKRGIIQLLSHKIIDTKINEPILTQFLKPNKASFFNLRLACSNPPFTKLPPTS